MTFLSPKFKLLAAKYGPPSIENEKGRRRLNPPFFAALLCAKKCLIYEKDERDFYSCGANGLWERVTEDSLVLYTAHLMLEVAQRMKWKALIADRTDHIARGIISFAKGIAEKEKPFSKSRGKIVHLTNGVLDIGANALLPHNPDFQSRNLVPIKYDPSALCPRFRQELLGGLSEDDVKLIQLWGGQVLLGVNMAQKILIVCGQGGGGKSSLLLIIAGLLGDQNVAQLRIDQLGNRFETASYADKMLLLGTDVRPDVFSEKCIGNLKSLTGNDLIDAELKFGNRRYRFRGNLNMGISCNGKPQFLVQGDESAWERRLLFVPFQADPPARKIIDFERVLIEEEGSGILRFFVEGARELSAALEKTGEFPMTDRQKNLAAELFHRRDVVQVFVSDCLVKEPEHVTYSADVFEAFINFCESRGFQCNLPPDQLRSDLCNKIWQTHKVSRRNDLPANGIHGGKSVRGYKGVRIDDRRTGRTGD